MAQWHPIETRYCLAEGMSVVRIADFLCREVGEVKAKIAELGPLNWKRPAAINRH